MRKLLFFIFTLLTYSVIAQSHKEFDSKDYLKNGDYLYNNTTFHKHEVLEILVNQKNKIFVNGSYFQTVKDIRPTILDFIKERKSYSRIIITIKSKSTDKNINNDIINSVGSYLIKQGITPKQGMVFLNPEDLVIPKEEVKPPPPPREIPEEIEIRENNLQINLQYNGRKSENSEIKFGYHDQFGMDELDEEDIYITRPEPPPPPTPPPPEIPEEIEIKENYLYLEVDDAETDQDKMMEIPEEESEEAFISVEKMPMLGDCKNLDCTHSEIMKFIARNFKYPEIAKANRVEGRVILEFVVEKNGKVGRIKILKGLDKHVDKAAIEVVEKLNAKEAPKFSPGRQIGKAVPVKYTVPIKCTLG